MLQRLDHYVFKNPFASSIYPILNAKQTLFWLHKINASRPPKTRLPLEILLYINKKVHGDRNVLLKKIRDSWTPAEDSFYPLLEGSPPSLRRLMLNISEKKYYLAQETAENDENGDIIRSVPYEQQDSNLMADLSSHISSADLLYRLRCCFPELSIDSDEDEEMPWDVYIQHNQTGFLLQIHDHIGCAVADVFGYREDSPFEKVDEVTKHTFSEAFASDMQLLFSVLHETIDGSRRLVYYHPAANADCFADDEQGYIAVPYEVTRDRESAPEFAYQPWRLHDFSIEDVSSSHSILHELKYDIPNREINRENGTANLTTVISSALLFYRLLCTFVLGYANENNYTDPPINSVWQVELIHPKTKNFIIFMDDRGLFDILASAEIEEIMGDVEVLVEALCSDECTHPHYGTVAGCTGSDLSILDFL